MSDASESAAIVATDVLYSKLPQGIDAHLQFVTSARAFYAPNIVWDAPSRGVQWQGRELVIRQLLREAGGMHDPEFTPLRRSRSDRKVIDEFAVRFVYSGAGIEAAPIQSGDFVELKRVRLLELSGDVCVHETCLETWTVLLPQTGLLSSPASMAPRSDVS